MVSPGVFSRKTLNDNWVEDRFQSEEALTATGSFHKRGPRSYETDLAYIGDRYDVLSRISRMPARPSYAAPDDGFNVKTTTNINDFQDPKTHPMFSSKKLSAPSLINTANAPVCPPEKRPLRGPESGFGAAISRHPKNYDHRFWNTTHSDFFGDPRKEDWRRDPGSHHAAGISTEHEENKVSGMKCGRLCGENHCESSNPAVDTRTQRSWMPGGDPALTHIHHGGTRKPVPKEDTYLSLPLGEGAMSKIRADLKQRQGRLYRNGTNITRGAHQRSGYAIFQDD